MAIKMKIRGEKVRYWSVYDQSWRTSHVCGVPDRELAAMSPRERGRVLRQAKKICR